MSKMSLIENFDWKDINTLFEGVTEGGVWTPADCAPRWRLAVIVPYRDRERALKVTLAQIIIILQRQQIAFRIYLVEQVNCFITIIPKV